MTKHNERNQERNQNEIPNDEARGFGGQGIRDEEIAVMLARIEARQEFSDKQNAERFAHLENALGVKITTTVVETAQAGFISRTWTNHKGKIITGTVVLLAAGFGGYKYSQSK